MKGLIGLRRDPNQKPPGDDTLHISVTTMKVAVTPVRW